MSKDISKRVLTKRGYAQLQAGNYTLEQLLADPKFSVEKTEGMKLTTLNIQAEIPAASSEAANDDDGGDPPEGSELNSGEQETGEQSREAPSLEVIQVELQEQKDLVSDLTAKLEAAQASATTMESTLAERDQTITDMKADIDKVRPVLESACKGLQMRVTGRETDLSTVSLSGLVETHSRLSEQFNKVFPGGQVAVVDDDGEQETSAQVSPMYQVLNRVNKF